MGNPGANEVSAEEQMETIPFNNFMSERETGEFGISEQQRPYPLQLNQEQQNPQSQLERLNDLRSGDLRQGVPGHEELEQH